MLSDYRKSHLKVGKGKTYARTFCENPYRSMVWQLEQEILDWIVQELFESRKIHHLDFACGTGRILEYLENRTDISVGVDLSPSMLEVARKRLNKTELIEADITKDDILGNRKFNLITAFRFFPNAQPQLRMEAIRKCVNLLDTDGYIVFNNHMNSSSLTRRLSILLKDISISGMSNADVESLLSEVRLRIEKIFHIGVIPSTDSHLLLPIPLLRFMERSMSKHKIFRNYAQNQIFVCKM